MAPPRDTLSRSWGGPQPKSQPAFLPDQIVRQGVLQRRPALRKFNFHTDSADVEAVQIFGNLQKPCDALFAGKGVIIVIPPTVLFIISRVTRQLYVMLFIMFVILYLSSTTTLIFEDHEHQYSHNIPQAEKHITNIYRLEIL